MSAAPPLSSCAPLRAVDVLRHPEGQPLWLAGRVVYVRDRRILLADASGSIEADLAHGLDVPRAGDLIELEGRRLEGARVLAGSVRVLTPHRGERPFPSPGGEYYRMHTPVPGQAEGLDRTVLLHRRARCLAAIRAFFAARAYVEVQTPLRVRTPGLEPYLVAQAAGPAYLITSPEYQMKRLLAAGMERIYFLGPCWRGDELGPQHLHEFCMLEWYRAFLSIEELLQETEALLAHVAMEVLGTTRITYQGRTLDLAPPYGRITFADALRRFTGLDIVGGLDARELRRRAAAAGIGSIAADDGLDEIVSRIIVERVEPGLVALGPTFLCEFPAPLAALARLKPDDPTVAERSELYIGGLELANAFGELTDPEEQRRRLLADQRARRVAGAPVYPIDERFLDALAEGIPPSAGIALGVDRLVMLLCDAPDIRQVVAFAPEEI